MMKSFLRSREGNFGITAALVFPVLLAAAGLAVDYTTLTRAKSELQNAIDAGVLAVSRSRGTEEERRAEFRRILSAQLSQNTDFDLVASDVKFNKGLDHIEALATASAEVPLLLMGQVAEGRVGAMASTYLSTRQLEIAIALDNTGSMGAGGIAALKKASHALVDILATVDTGKQKLNVALIPFVTAVNIKGAGFDESWIDVEGRALYNGWAYLTDGQRTNRKRYSDQRNQTNYPHHMNLFAWSGTNWKGCVEARPAPYNTSTASPDPADPDTLFVPYFAPDEPGDPMPRGGNSATHYNNSWLDDHVGGPDETRQRVEVKYKLETPNPGSFNDAAGPLTIGPNRACPTPIVPLTPDLADIRAGIDAMQYWNGSGTNIGEGLAWGWRVLSPAPPYTQAKPYSASVSKILVLMTDGTNVSYGSRNTMNMSDYGSYGFLSEGRINGTTTQSSAERQLNVWTADMCLKMKEQDIEIYTVIYNTTAASVVDMFKKCVSRPENYFMANDTEALQAAFADIGKAVAGVRLTH